MTTKGGCLDFIFLDTRPPPTLPLDPLLHLLRKHSKIKFSTVSAISGMVQKEVDCFVSPSMLPTKS